MEETERGTRHGESSTDIDTKDTMEIENYDMMAVEDDEENGANNYLAFICRSLGFFQNRTQKNSGIHFLHHLNIGLFLQYFYLLKHLKYSVIHQLFRG